VLQSGRSGMKVLVWIDLPSLAVQGRYMVSVLDAIGFRASLHVAAPTAYFPTVDDSRHRVQVGIDAWQSDFPSLAGFLAPLFLCSSFVPGSAAQTVDPSELCDPALDREINRAIATQAVDPPAANALWQQTERTILATAPIVPIYNPRNIDLVSKRVGDYQYNPQWGVLLDQLWVR